MSQLNLLSFLVHYIFVEFKVVVLLVINYLVTYV